MRDLAPAEHGQRLEPSDLLDPLQRFVTAPRRQEGQADRVVTGRRQAETADRTEELVGDLSQDPGTVAGLRVGALGAPVIKVAQDAERLDNRAVLAPPRQVGDHPYPACVMLELRVIEACARRFLGF